MSDLPQPFDPGPPWSRVIPARWGFWIEHGSAPLLVDCRDMHGSPKRWWRRTQAGADAKARRLIEQAWKRRNHDDRGYTIEGERSG